MPQTIESEWGNETKKCNVLTNKLDIIIPLGKILHVQISIIHFTLKFHIDSFPFPSFPFRFFGFTGHIRVCMFVALNFSLSGLIAIVILYVARERRF